MKPEFLQTFFQGLIFLGALLTAIGSTGAYYFGGKVTDITNKKTQEQLETINNQSNQIQTLSQQNVDLSKLNLDMSSTIQVQTDELTARGSYPVGSAAGGAEQGNKMQIVIDLFGKYAIPDLMLNINVIPNYSKVSALSINTLGLNPTSIGPDILRAREFKYFHVDTLTKETAILVRYISNNKSWTQWFRVIKTENGRKVMSFLKDSQGKTLATHVDKGFPQIDGKFVIWSGVLKSLDEL